ncbi:MAG: protein BatD [Muribaculaceae bacterium]|nr:protein BatD [Muribaculaceae bacterium]
MKRINLLLLFLLTLILAHAEVSFTVLPPRQVIEGNKFNVTFRLKNAEGSDIKAPQIEGCKLLFGPSTSTMSSYQMINGKTTSSTSVDYSFVYRAEKAGTYTIAETSIKVDGKTYTSEAVKFTVLPADNSGSQGVKVDDYSTHTTDKKVSTNDVFVRIITSKSQAYEQEAIECTIKLYTKYSISSFMATNQPSFDGFLIEEKDIKSSLNEMENYNGQNYMTAVLKKCIIFPQKAGKLTINSGKYDISVVQYEMVSNGFFIDKRPVERQISVSSNSASVQVNPLPSPQPDDFNGAVGNFALNSELSSTSFRTNEAASLIYKISGTGNIKYVKEPVVDFPSEFEQYTPKNDIKASVVGNNVKGQITIEYTFVPQNVGNFKIGSTNFVYFDPSAKKYVTLTTPEYDITVAKGVGTSITSTAQSEISTKNRDILHIKLGDKHPSRENIYYITSVLYWLIYLLLAMGLGASIYFNIRKIKLNADVQGSRLAKANKVARLRLKKAKQFMDAKANDAFYEEVLKALWGYFSDKLLIPSSQLNRDNITAELFSYGAQQQLIDTIIYVLDECEMARYTPQKSDEQVEQLYKTTTQVMNEMESINTKRK